MDKSGTPKTEKVLLDVSNLTVSFTHDKQEHQVLHGISFELYEGEILGLIGESGSGKTMTSLAIADLLSPEAVVSGNICFDGQQLTELSAEQLRELKGTSMSMIFQEPMTSLNPLLTIGFQVEEVLKIHHKVIENGYKSAVLEMLKEVGLPNVETLYDKYPHQLSGGQRQRVMIAMAMICRSKLLIADEPTTALDATTQVQIIDLIKKLNQHYGTAVIVISHNLGIVKNLCRRALVMHNGLIVESATVKELFENPQHEYTKKLLNAIPHMEISNEQSECRSNPAVLEIENLNAFYPENQRRLFKPKIRKQVVFDVSFMLKQGEVLGIVGESGSGKSTLAKTIVGLQDDYTGTIKHYTSRPQMVFQDPYGSLNSAYNVGWILEEPLRIIGGYTPKQRQQMVLEMLNQVGLEPKHANRYLSQLSGGQRQRVSIANALMLNSKLLVLDEPVSALDVTVQSQILDLLQELKQRYKLSYLFISHDLRVIYRMCDYVCVMYKGKIVEKAPVEQLYNNPQHEYTKLLLNAAK